MDVNESHVLGKFDKTEDFDEPDKNGIYWITQSCTLARVTKKYIEKMEKNLGTLMPLTEKNRHLWMNDPYLENFGNEKYYFFEKHTLKDPYPLVKIVNNNRYYIESPKVIDTFD